MADDLWSPGFANQPSVPIGQGGIKIAKGPLPRVTDEKSYAAIPGGGEYLDPQGQKRRKDWSVKSAADYRDVPEGAEYLDPQGVRRSKTKYEGVNFTTQTLYDMTATESERFNVLAKTYGKENVKKDPLLNEWYVETGGTKLKPGSGDMVPRAGAAILAGGGPAAGYFFLLRLGAPAENATKKKATAKTLPSGSPNFLAIIRVEKPTRCAQTCFPPIPNND